MAREMVSTATAAEKLGISDSRMRVLLRAGRVRGAIAVGQRAWAIPLNGDGLPHVKEKGPGLAMGEWVKPKPKRRRKAKR